MRGYLTTIERVTGHAPTTCPWRAFYDPLVREVLDISWADDGNLAAVIGMDPPYQLVQALGVYKRAVTMTRAEEERIQRDERKAKADAERAARKAGARG